MPNLIGTGNNQIPTNGMLGGLAYQSPDNAVIRNLELTNLSGHNSVIPSNALDVFVYDTRKDSDGGQWRKRTQHTSWYNETLNTATRGSRRDFPAVAIIVTTASSVTIYDGDDPDMPMWMVFNGVTVWNQGLYFNGNTSGCVFALNGVVCWGDNNNAFVLTRVNFITDNTYINASNTNYGGQDILPLSQRNSSGHTFFAGTGSLPVSATLVNNYVNDVAMTVLPNAPIDSATGLPVPTIAVATNGGVSVIKDDGNIANLTFSSLAVKTVTFDKNNGLWACFASGGSGIGWHYYTNFTTTSSLPTPVHYNSGWTASFDMFGGVNYYGVGYNYSDFSAGTLALNNFTGFGAIKASTTMSNFITTSYNTGWMHGDIKGAWLSDTSTTSVSGTALLTGQASTYDVNTTNGGWTAQASATATYNATNGVGNTGCIALTASGGSNIYTSLQISSSLVVGQKYSLTFSHKAASPNNPTLFTISSLANNSGTTYYSATINSSTSHITFTILFTATSTTAWFSAFAGLGNGVVVYVDNIDLRLLSEADRSVNNNGFAVYGTITKSPVATGSNLVAYSGFSGSNYLQQPYNAALNFNTGDFSFLAWIYPTANSPGGIISRGSNGVYGPYALNYNNNTLTFVCSANWNESTDDGNWGTLIQNVGNIPLNTWSFVAVTFSGTTARVYVNGVVVGTQTNAVNPKAPTSNFIPTMIGVERTPLTGAIGRPFPGSLSLVRASASAPSPEQIRKIYEDEKALFQPNSQCTLFGSSDAVTALAYDDTNSTLLVGTSSGRSDFRGLERINNTTTAVTTAISASNGLVVEQ